MLRNIIAKG